MEKDNKRQAGKTSIRLRFQKGDFFAVGAVLMLAVVVLCLFLPGKHQEAAMAEIYQDGVLIKTVSLGVDTEFTVEGDYTNTVTVKDGKIAITEADCPGEDCVHSGWINASGRSIVCLPNRLEIRVISDDSDVDFTVG